MVSWHLRGRPPIARKVLGTAIPSSTNHSAGSTRRPSVLRGPFEILLMNWVFFYTEAWPQTIPFQAPNGNSYPKLGWIFIEFSVQYYVSLVRSQGFICPLCRGLLPARLPGSLVSGWSPRQQKSNIFWNDKTRIISNFLDFYSRNLVVWSIYSQMSF